MRRDWRSELRFYGWYGPEHLPPTYTPVMSPDLAAHRLDDRIGGGRPGKRRSHDDCGERRDEDLPHVPIPFRSAPSSERFLADDALAAQRVADAEPVRTYRLRVRGRHEDRRQRQSHHHSCRHTAHPVLLFRPSEPSNMYQNGRRRQEGAPGFSPT